MTNKAIISANDVPQLWRVLKWMLIIGISMIFLFSLRWLYPEEKGRPFVDILASGGTGLLLGGACFAAGGLLGFLFAIPKVIQNGAAALADDGIVGKASIVQNDNLVQISDWFTKIIVGVGLTQLYEIPHFILRVGEELKGSFGGDEWARNQAISIVLYFTTIGFLAVYIWTRLHFAKMLGEVSRDLRQELVDKEIENKIKEEDIQAMVQTFSAGADKIKENIQEIKSSEIISGDPQKGKWGGMTEANNRKVTATVRETSFNSDWFNITLVVESTNSEAPLSGDVIFHLHPSFPKTDEIIQAANGVAQLNIVGWGAFTVGVECDNGRTMLEIDLSELANAPQNFKNR